MVDAGKLKPNIGKTHTCAELVPAFKYLMDGPLRSAMALALQEAQRLLGAISVSLRGGGASLQSSRPSVDWTSDVGIILVYAAIIFALNWLVRLVVVSPVAKALLSGSKLESRALA